MKKRIHHVAKKARENPEGAVRAIMVYVLTAMMCACMARQVWRGEKPGLCCDKIIPAGASASAAQPASAVVRTISEEK